MKKVFALLIMTNLMLVGCKVIPMPVLDHPPQPAPRACPPGQAKKGNCAPESERGFCPPGQAKKGNC